MSKLKQLLFSLNETDRKVIEEKLKTQDQQIDQIKHQLEELMLLLSKYEIEEHKPVYCALAGTECEYLGKVEELKQQLAEKDTRIAELEDKDWYEACIKQLEEQNNRLIDTLKEKDKEIERLNTIKNSAIECADLFKVALSVRQKDLAIQQLEKVKELLLDEYKKYPIVYDKTNDIVAGALDRDKVNEIIDQQIKKLKGEKDVKD